jgi:hypothetical protein
MYVIHKGKGHEEPCSNYSKEMVFLASKTLMSPLGLGWKSFSSTSNVKILQIRRTECVRFTGDIEIEVIYMIL